MRFVNKMWFRGLDKQVGFRNVNIHWKKWINITRNIKKDLKITFNLECAKNFVHVL